MDVLCIGAAVLDVAARPVSAQDFGENKNRIDSINFYAGGDAANQARTLSLLGSGVALAAKTGADFQGSALCAKLQQSSVDVSAVSQTAGLSTTVSLVLVDKSGGRSIFTASGGAHSALNHSDLFSSLFEGESGDFATAPLKRKFRAVSIGSLFSCPELEKDGLTELLTRFRREGTLVFADLSTDKQNRGLQGLAHLFPLIDYFLPSEYDAKLLTGTESYQDAAQILLEHGVKCAIIKLGTQGCFLAGANEREHIPACPVEALDTTGAGDCFCGAFIHRVLASDSPQCAARYASAAAAFSTRYEGGSSAPLSDEAVRGFAKARDYALEDA
jgi:sugar/nucleoside kinase (ribokinase family)